MDLTTLEPMDVAGRLDRLREAFEAAHVDAGDRHVLVGGHAEVAAVHAGDLAAGLWQALLVSAAGLAVSIPAYAGYNMLVGRVEALTLDMERAAAEVVNFFELNKVGDAIKKEKKA